MFNSTRWAKALINSLENAGAEIEDGINFFRLIASGVKTIPGDVAGRTAAEKLEPLIRRAAEAAGTEKAESFSPAMEIAVRFLILMVKKNELRHIDSVAEKAKKILDEKRGIISAHAEYAFEPEEQFKSLLSNAIKKRTGAAGVELTGRLNPALIGGYRLRIGDEVIDASVRSQLKKLLVTLQSGQVVGGNP